MFNRKVKQLEKTVEELKAEVKHLKSVVEFIQETDRINSKKNAMKQLEDKINKEYLKDLPLVCSIAMQHDEKFGLTICEVVNKDRMKQIHAQIGYDWELRKLIDRSDSWAAQDNELERIIKSWQWDNREKYQPKSPWASIDCPKY